MPTPGKQDQSSAVIGPLCQHGVRDSPGLKSLQCTKVRQRKGGRKEILYLYFTGGGLKV